MKEDVPRTFTIDADGVLENEKLRLADRQVAGADRARRAESKQAT